MNVILQSVYQEYKLIREICNNTSFFEVGCNKTSPFYNYYISKPILISWCSTLGWKWSSWEVIGKLHNIFFGSDPSRNCSFSCLNQSASRFDFFSQTFRGPNLQLILFLLARCATYLNFFMFSLTFNTGSCNYTSFFAEWISKRWFIVSLSSFLCLPVGVLL